MATKSRHLKTAIQLWVADERKAGGYTSADLAAWTGVTMDTARGWESRGRPSEDAIRILERHFGKAAPVGESAAPGDQAALVTALQAQTDALTALVDELRQWRTGDRERLEGVEAIVDRLVAGTLGAPGTPERAEPPVPDGTAGRPA